MKKTVQVVLLNEVGEVLAVSRKTLVTCFKTDGYIGQIIKGW